MLGDDKQVALAGPDGILFGNDQHLVTMASKIPKLHGSVGKSFNIY